MNAPKALTPAVATSVGYAFLDKRGGEISDPQTFYDGLAFVQGGHFPLGRHGFFHGGIHIGQASGNALSLDGGRVRCLADGEVVAYRVNVRNHDATPGANESSSALRPYSTGFVLVRHRLQAPTPPEPSKPVPMRNPGADVGNWGTYLYSDQEGRERIAWLPHGALVTVEVGPSDRTGLLRVVDTVGEGVPREGWIKRTCLALDPAAGEGLLGFFGFKERIVAFVQQGDFVDQNKAAAYRANQVEQLHAAPPAAPVLTLYSLYMHVAAFEDYQKNVSWSRPAWWLEHDGVRQPHSTESVVVLPLPVPLRRGETIGYMGEDVPSYAGLLAGQPTSQRLLHLEVFSGDDVPAYFVASRNWAKEYVPDTDRTLLVLHPGDALQGDSGRAISVNQRQILPVQGLSARTVEGKRWRKVSLPASQGNLEGWIEEAAHAVSPWEWPGFDVHEGLAAEDGFRHDNVEGFAKYIRGEEPRPPDTPFYQTLRAFIDRDRDGHLSEEELDHVLRSRFLADMIGRVVVRHESAWSGSYLKKQMATAECIARLLGPAALECRRNEVPRAERLPWWDDVSSKVEGFPTNTKVYHFHPGGLAGTFIGARDDKAPWMEIAIRELKRWGGTKETVIDDTVNYHREIGLNFDSLTTAWCASFVNYCLKEAGYAHSASAGSQSFKSSPNFRRIDAAVYGALVVYSNPKKPGQGHVAFIYSKLKGGDLAVLGGNQGDSITLNAHLGVYLNTLHYKLEGFYVPTAYKEHADKQIAFGGDLGEEVYDLASLRASFGKTSAVTSSDGNTR